MVEKAEERRHMGTDVFRTVALKFPEAEEKSHFGKADFRVRNKIFAGFTAEGLGYVKLTADEQEMLCAAEPLIMSPIKDGWGRQGWTVVDQSAADAGLVRSVLGIAWRNVAPKSIAAPDHGTA